MQRTILTRFYSAATLTDLQARFWTDSPRRTFRPTRVEAPYAEPRTDGPPEPGDGVRTPPAPIGSTPDGPSRFGLCEEVTMNAATDKSRPPPRCGPYYWFPRPSEGGPSWTILTCHDAGLPADTGHARLWTWLLVQLATAWGRDHVALGRRLGLFYTGLPRGRVTRPGKESLILHGNDSPISAWEALVVEHFRLSGRKVKFLFDEHETQISGHPEAFATASGIPLPDRTSTKGSRGSPADPPARAHRPRK